MIYVFYTSGTRDEQVSLKFVLLRWPLVGVVATQTGKCVVMTFRFYLETFSRMLGAHGWVDWVTKKSLEGVTK